MTKIVNIVFAGIALSGAMVMTAASSWGADNLPHQVHIVAWHIVALR